MPGAFARFLAEGHEARLLACPDNVSAVPLPAFLAAASWPISELMSSDGYTMLTDDQIELRAFDKWAVEKIDFWVSQNFAASSVKVPPLSPQVEYEVRGTSNEVPVASGSYRSAPVHISPVDAPKVAAVASNASPRRLMGKKRIVDALDGKVKGISLSSVLDNPTKLGREGLLAARTGRGVFDLDAVIAWLREKGYYCDDDVDANTPQPSVHPAFSQLGNRRA